MYSEYTGLQSIDQLMELWSVFLCSLRPKGLPELPSNLATGRGPGFPNRAM